MSASGEFEPIDVHSLNVAPGEESFTFFATFYHAGEMEPLPYPDPFADRDEADEDWEIDVHSLNVAPWEESFSVPAVVVMGEPWEPLPYFDPLGYLEEDDDSVR